MREISLSLKSLGWTHDNSKVVVLSFTRAFSDRFFVDELLACKVFEAMFLTSQPLRANHFVRYNGALGSALGWVTIQNHIAVLLLYASFSFVCLSCLLEFFALNTVQLCIELVVCERLWQPTWDVSFFHVFLLYRELLLDSLDQVQLTISLLNILRATFIWQLSISPLGWWLVVLVEDVRSALQHCGWLVFVQILPDNFIDARLI